MPREDSLLVMYNAIFIQQIVALSKYGHFALDICHPYVTYILRSFVSRGKENCKKCRRNDQNTLKERFVINLLNNKTIILLYLAEYGLILVHSAFVLFGKVSDDIFRDCAW